MTKLLWAILALAVIYVSLRIGVSIMSRTAATGGLQTNNGVNSLGDCPDKPNCQGSQSSRKAQIVEPLTLPGSAQNAPDAIAAAVQQLGGKMATQQDQYMHATFKTTLMAYIDDVEFLIDEDAAVVHIRSASRLGHSDLGANKKRVEAIRAALAGKL